MTDQLLVFDILLSVAIVGIAGLTLLVRDAFAMIVAFVVFGIFVAIGFVRLMAPDVALAEAAIGTGVTGALMLRALAHLRGGSLSGPDAAASPGPTRATTLGLDTVLATGVTVALGVAFLGAPQAGPGLEAEVAAAMPQSGVAHPVTAVLLNFRSYDTLMEVVVLLAAVIVVWQIDRGLSDAAEPIPGEIYQGFSRAILPVGVVIGGYLLWIGATAPGGAFQAGAVLAAVAVLVLLSKLYTPAASHRHIARAAFVAGTVVFAAVALGVAGGGRTAFEYPAGHAKTFILLIEAAVTVSIAVTLAALFHGREPAAPIRKETR